ncbi:MAG: SDR family NAD(P)-dependent oxidoreductase [Deltaproteobacteria bacterium]
MRFVGKIALVTGGGTGIGRATAALLAAEGAAVLITGRREEKLREVASEIERVGGRARYIAGDVSSVADTEKIVAECVRVFGGLDILINNAGVFRGMKITDVAEGEFDRIINTNLKGTYFMSKSAVPVMRARGGGAIVNVGSTLGLKGIRKSAVTVYAASKGGVVMLTKTLALELAPDNIRVNCICPAVVETEIFETLGIPKEEIAQRMKNWEAFHPLGRNGKPAEAARAILFLASDDSAWTTGAIFTLDGGVMAE